VIPTVVAQVLAGGRVALGTVDTVRDFTFIDDTVRGFMAAATAAGVEGEVIQLGTGVGTTIRDVVAMVGAIVGRRIEPLAEARRMRPAGSEVDRLVCDAGLARRRLGWAPMVALRAGLVRTIDWIRAHADRYRPEEYCV